MHLPNTVEDLTPDWLSQALSMNFPGTVVTSVVRGTLINGTATKQRLLLEYNDAGHGYGLPPTLWFKGGLEAHSEGEAMLSVYAAEASFYRDLAPQLNLTLPLGHFAYIDPGTGRSALLLEDMLGRNARFGHVTRPASPKLAASVLTQLARLHGAFWEDNRLKQDKIFAEGGARLASFLNDYNFDAANWTRSLTLPRGRFATGPLADRNYIVAMVQKMLAQDNARGGSLVHGDAHLGNVCILPGEQASYLDWQTVMLGFWAHDVAYFLTGALSISDRRLHERALITHYAAALREAGGKLDDATAWWEYRKHALYAYCWFPCAPEWQPEEVIYQNTERAVAAMADLDTLACWKD